MTAIYDYNQGIVNFMKFALQWVLIRLSRSYNNNNGNIGSLCVLTFFTICSHSIHRNSFRSRLEKKVEQKKSIWLSNSFGEVTKSVVLVYVVFYRKGKVAQAFWHICKKERKEFKGRIHTIFLQTLRNIKKDIIMKTTKEHL